MNKGIQDERIAKADDILDRTVHLACASSNSEIQNLRLEASDLLVASPFLNGDAPPESWNPGPWLERGPACSSIY